MSRALTPEQFMAALEVKTKCENESRMSTATIFFQIQPPTKLIGFGNHPLRQAGRVEFETGDAAQ
ncbi:hypothetical protein S58_69190 [Bradyrhizobium oligotrophicum S58]|uniref:Uncharacterized protein n=1 Tax=Bradyrhizobium oligotrophicum S58 TaxID=1245469 RepID=M5A1Z0_9BRAD|nr:hypothetical protein S58_69190 [Bradyrhizobium oligotrophicum S58]